METNAKTLAPEMLHKMDAYWRAANYGANTRDTHAGRCLSLIAVPQPCASLRFPSIVGHL